MNVNQKEIKKYMYLISFAGVVLAIILNLSSISFYSNYMETYCSFFSRVLYCFCIKYYY